MSKATYVDDPEKEIAQRLSELEDQKRRITDQAIRVRTIEQEVCDEKAALQALLRLSESIIEEQAGLEREFEEISHQQDAFEEEIVRLEKEAAKRGDSEKAASREVLEAMEREVDSMLERVNLCIGCNPETGMAPLLDAHITQLNKDNDDITDMIEKLEI